MLDYIENAVKEISGRAIQIGTIPSPRRFSVKCRAGVPCQRVYGHSTARLRHKPMSWLVGKARC